MDQHIIIDGHFVSQKVSQVVQAIQEYSPELEVQYVPLGARREGQAAFAIRHNPPGSSSYVMFYVKDEKDFDERVLQRIIANDQRNGTPTLSEYEAWEAANQAVERQKFLDKMEEANDIAAHVLRSPLNTYRVNKDLVIRD